MGEDGNNNKNDEHAMASNMDNIDTDGGNTIKLTLNKLFKRYAEQNELPSARNTQPEQMTNKVA